MLESALQGNGGTLRETSDQHMLGGHLLFQFLDFGQNHRNRSSIRATLVLIDVVGRADMNNFLSVELAPAPELLIPIARLLQKGSRKVMPGPAGKTLKGLPCHGPSFRRIPETVQPNHRSGGRRLCLADNQVASCVFGHGSAMLRGSSGDVLRSCDVVLRASHVETNANAEASLLTCCLSCEPSPA